MTGPAAPLPSGVPGPSGPAPRGQARAGHAARDLDALARALGDPATAALAGAALHLAAQTLRRERERPAPEPLSEAQRAVLARFGIDVTKVMPVEEFLASESVLRGFEHHARVLAGALSVAEAARRLGVGPARVRQRIRGGTLLALRGPDRAWRIPAFQFGDDDGGELPYLARVLGCARRPLSPLGADSAFALPDEEFGGLSARNWLLAGGDPAPVARLVASL